MNNVKICPYCHKNNKETWIYTAGFDVDAYKLNRIKCITCGKNLEDTILTVEEYAILEETSIDVSFFDAMIDLKQKDPIEFNLKLAQFKTQVGQQQNNNNSNQLKCPTCSSTNVQKISGTAKVAGALTFGLLSKTARSQFKCGNCGYKW